MKKSILVKILTLLAVVSAFPLVVGHASAATAESTAPTGTLVPVTDKTDAAWLAKARAAYPLDSCVVSGDKFDGGPMGKADDFLYRQSGKPDRLVRFCCKDCITDFKKDPAQYLGKLDAAVTAKKPAAKK